MTTHKELTKLVLRDFAMWLSDNTYITDTGDRALNESIGSRFPHTYSLGELYRIFLDDTQPDLFI